MNSHANTHQLQLKDERKEKSGGSLNVDLYFTEEDIMSQGIVMDDCIWILLPFGSHASERT